jgi:hypothetical protein
MTTGVISLYTVSPMKYWTVSTQSLEASRPFHTYFCPILALLFSPLFCLFSSALGCSCLGMVLYKGGGVKGLMAAYV